MSRRRSSAVPGEGIAQPGQFDALYRGEGATFGGEHMAVAPWQLDEPQPVVLEIADGDLPDPVLECGCGVGDNALALAARGRRVTAVDASPAAIEQCRDKASRRGLDVTFQVADATALDGVGAGYRTVLDSALLHCLDRPRRRAYLAALHRVSAPGARLHLLCCDEQAPATMPLAGGLDEASLRADLAPHWRVESMRRRRYTTGLTRAVWHTTMTPIVGAYPGDLDRPGAVDEHDRVRLPIWQILATRR